MTKKEEKEMFLRFCNEAGKDTYVGEALRALAPLLDHAIDCDFSGTFAVEQLNKTISERLKEISDLEMRCCEKRKDLEVLQIEERKWKSTLAQARFNVNKLARASQLFGQIKRELEKVEVEQ
jgi:hypothetical protein